MLALSSLSCAAFLKIPAVSVLVAWTNQSDITDEAAEAACAGLKDEFDRNSCVYDILDMVGAY